LTLSILVLDSKILTLGGSCGIIGKYKGGLCSRHNPPRERGCLTKRIPKYPNQN